MPLIVSLFVAIMTAQREQVHGLSDLFGLVEWTYLALLLWVALAGAGKVSLDHLLFHAKAERRGQAEPSRIPQAA